jgi:O-antigen/teichoic acid export membrane protein
MAYNGMSYWGIATQSIIYCLFIAALCWHFSKWRPNFQISLKPLKEMVGFSSKMLVTSMFSHLNGNLFSIVFGRFYTQTDVGNYNQSNKWNAMGHSFITGTIQGVAQPVLTQVRTDAERQRNVFRKMLRFTAFISFPLMFGLSLIARELIVITITEKWLAAVMFLQILCIDGAFIPIGKLYSNLIISKGKSNIFMWNTMAICLIQFSLMLSLKSYGVDCLVKVFVSVDILWLLIWHYFVWREIKLSFIDALKDIVPFLLMALLTMVCTYFITIPIHNMYVLFFAKIVIASVLYIGALWLLNAKILKESIQFFVKKKL